MNLATSKQRRDTKKKLYGFMKARGIHPIRPNTARQEILQTLCELCKQLREKLEGKAEKYEKKWKRNKDGMSERDRMDILTTLVDMPT